MRLGATRGFTLVELVGVMVVMAIIAGAAVPAISGVSRARERADRDSAAASLRLARALAVASGTPHAARFAGPGEAVRVERLSPISGSPEPAVDPLGELVPAPIVRADAATTVGGRPVTAGGLRVWFDADGTPLEVGSDPVGGEAADEPVIVLFDSGERLVVRARTGAIQR